MVAMQTTNSRVHANNNLVNCFINLFWKMKLKKKTKEILTRSKLFIGKENKSANWLNIIRMVEQNENLLMRMSSQLGNEIKLTQR